MHGGTSFSLAIVPDGSLLSFGPLQDGQPTSTRTIARISGVPVALGVGSQHALVVTADGGVWSLGDNTWGQLGPRTVSSGDATLPAQIQGLSNIVSAAAGGGHSVALDSEGNVWTWGRNDHGQLGVGTISPQLEVPTKLVGLDDVVTVAAGENYTLALRADGTVWAWGDDEHGQLGNGQAGGMVAAPVQVAALSDVTSLAAGSDHGLALKSDGTVWAWGDNTAGKLGDGGSEALSAQPVEVAGLEKVVGIAAGQGHSLALEADGSVMAWGANQAGQLGTDDNLAHATPVLVPGLSQVDRIGAGALHSLAARTADGAIWAWGDAQGAILDTATRADGAAAPADDGSLSPTRLSLPSPGGKAARATVASRQKMASAASASSAPVGANSLSASPDAPQAKVRMFFNGKWPNYSGSTPPTLPAINLSIGPAGSPVATITQTIVKTSTAFSGGTYLGSTGASGSPSDMPIALGSEFPLKLTFAGNGPYWPVIAGRVWGSPDNDTAHLANLLIFSAGKGYYLTNDDGGIWNESTFQTTGNSSMPYSPTTTPTQQLVAPSTNFQDARLWAVNFDLDVDSTNDVGTGLPSRSAAQEAVEETSAKKVSIGSNTTNLVPVVLEVSPDTLEYSKIRIRFEFDAGSIKLWNIQDPNTPRTNGNALLPSTSTSPVYYEATSLGLASGHSVLLFYVEALGGTSIPLKAIFAFNGGGNANGPNAYGEYFHDQVLLSAVVPGAPVFPLSEDDASGTRYRKIALNGRPMPDEKPQRRSESDEQSEESFIDALNLTLHHDTTEVYVPLPTDQLSLTVRRSAQPEVWNARNGLRPDERPDRPFGLGWSSNLAASIHFIFQDQNSGPTAALAADYAYVTDEQGSVYRFVVLYDSNGNKSYFPLPHSQHDQDGYQATLTGTSTNAGGTPYTFTRKYGTSLQFSDATIPALVSPLPGDRINSGATPVRETHRFARLDSVQDRFGVKLSCAFSDASSPLIPSQISASANGTSLQSLSITSANGLVQSVTDPNGKVYNYAYKSDNSSLPPDAQTNSIPSYPATSTYSTLASVQAPPMPSGSRPTTAYVFSTATEDDAAPVPAAKTTAQLTPAYHCELAGITDPDNKTYTLTYAFDTSRKAYLASTQQDYTENGNPRNVAQVDLPDSLGSTTFANHSYLALRPYTDAQGNFAPIFYGHRATFVVDAHLSGAQGNGRLYNFSGSTAAVQPSVMELNDSFKPFLKNALPQNPVSKPRLVSFPEMVVTHYQGSDVTFGDDTSNPTTLSYTEGSVTRLGQEVFTFDLSAGLALSSVKDFSGNVTSYVYGDAWAPLADKAAFANLHLTYPISRYADPTQQSAPATANADGSTQNHVKSFQYGGNFRTMTRSTDDAGRVTTYTLNALDERTQEQVAAPDGTVVQTTLLEYADGRFAHFLTKHTLKLLSGDPTWTPPALSTDLVTIDSPDAFGRLQSEVVDPGDSTHQNLTTSYLYDSNNNKTRVTDPRQNVTGFVYSNQNRLIETDYPAAGTPAAASKRTYVYDPRGNKTSETDENGHATLFTYDGLNRVTQTSRALADGTTITTKAAYNAVGSKTSATDANNHATSMVYDGLQRLTGTTDARNQTTTFAYGSNAGASAFDSSSWKPTHTVDPRNVTIDMVYDALYRPVSHTLTDQSQSPALVSKVQHAYDAVGNATGETDPLGHVTTTAYDALNRPVQVTFADTKTQQMLYTGTGLKYRMVDELLRATDMQYDGAGRLVKTLGTAVDDGTGTNTQAQPVTQTLYDASGNAVASIDPLNHRWDFGYDARNRKTAEDRPAVLDAVSGQTQRPHLSWEYDLVGNKTAGVDARGDRTETAYDWANRAVQVTAPPVLVAGSTTAVRPVTTTVYDLAGNVLRLTDPNAHTTVNTYDELNRLATTTDAENDMVTNGYDAVGNKTSVQDGKQQTTLFAFDGLNRNTKVTDAAGKATVFAYDALNKTQRTDALSQVTTYGYDARNRLTSLTYPDSTQDDRTYSLDAVGNVLSVTLPNNGDATRDVAYTFDALNRVQTETSFGLTHAYTYDLASRRRQTTYGGTSRTVVCQYDDLGRMTSFAEGGRATTYAYDLDGNALQKTLGNSETVVSSFDALNRVSRIQGNAGGGAELYHSAYTYDAGGNVRSNQEYSGTAIPTRTVAMGYDGADRLTSEAVTSGGATHTTTYGYDAAHNRTSKTVDGGTALASTYNALNQLTAFGGTTYAYDLDGNRTTSNAGSQLTSYSYDVENRLVSVALPTVGAKGTNHTTSQSYAYAYDYRGRRVLQQSTRTIGGVPGATVTSTWQSYSDGLSVEEYTASATDGNSQAVPKPGTNAVNAGGSPAADGTTLSAEYLRGPSMGGGVGGLLYSLRSGAASYDHYDNRGDVIAKTDASGVVTYQASYEAFGTRTAQYGSTPDVQRANTKEEDPTGLLDEGLRYRDLATGVFITRDPMGMVDGPNLYSYVRQNPWTSFDPEGLERLRPTKRNEEPFQAEKDLVYGAKTAGILLGYGAATLSDGILNAIAAVDGGDGKGNYESNPVRHSLGLPIFGQEISQQEYRQLQDAAEGLAFTLSAPYTNSGLHEGDIRLNNSAEIVKPDQSARIDYQKAIDQIHDAAYGTSFYGDLNPMTLMVTVEGNIILSQVTGKPVPKARAEAEKIFGAGNVSYASGKQSNDNEPNGHHSEARAINSAGDSAKGAMQYSSHFACPDCEQSQKAAGVLNMTGNASDNNDKQSRK